MRQGRISLALRGIAALAVLVALAVLGVLDGAGAFSSGPTVTVRVPADSGPVHTQDQVEYQGVQVGTVIGTRSDPTGSVLTLRMDPNDLDRIPATVRTRMVPRTLFGDQYVELVAQPGSGGGRLASGAVLAADRSAGTVQLYQAYQRLYDLLTAVQPAQVDAVLGTVADVLRGRGAQLGRMIDQFDALARQAAPTVANIGTDLSTVANLSRQLATSAPDLWRTLDDTVTLSDTVVAKQQNLAELLSSGADLSEQSQQLLANNQERLIQLVHAGGAVLGPLSARSPQILTTLRNLHEFADAGRRAFSTGRFTIEAPIVLTDPYPYQPSDCPRYPGLAGPNCGRTVPGGTAGPVGSQQEKSTLTQVLPNLVGPQGTPPSPDLLGLLLGPVLRGTQVVVP